MYGTELIIDLHDCDPSSFTRENIQEFCSVLCYVIDMERCDLHFWDDLNTPEQEKQTDPKTKGTSAIQFIITSNITIHTLDDIGKVFINLFSCKPFDSGDAVKVMTDYFSGTVANRVEVSRI